MTMSTSTSTLLHRVLHKEKTLPEGDLHISIFQLALSTESIHTAVNKMLKISLSLKVFVKLDLPCQNSLSLKLL